MALLVYFCSSGGWLSWFTSGDLPKSPIITSGSLWKIGVLRIVLNVGSPKLQALKKDLYLDQLKKISFSRRSLDLPNNASSQDPCNHVFFTATSSWHY